MNFDEIKKNNANINLYNNNTIVINSIILQFILYKCNFQDEINEIIDDIDGAIMKTLLNTIILNK